MGKLDDIFSTLADKPTLSNTAIAIQQVKDLAKAALGADEQIMDGPPDAHMPQVVRNDFRDMVRRQIDTEW